MKLSLENVHADSLSNWSGGGRCAIGWDYAGARYHFWINMPSRESQGILYKNPPLGLKTTDAGYFNTRQLDPEAKANAAMVAEAWAIVERDHLIEKMFAAEKEEKRKAAAELEENLRINRIQVAGVDLYEALRHAQDELERLASGGACVRPDVIFAVAKAIKKAEGSR